MVVYLRVMLIDSDTNSVSKFDSTDPNKLASIISTIKASKVFHDSMFGSSVESATVYMRSYRGFGTDFPTVEWLIIDFSGDTRLLVDFVARTCYRIDSYASDYDPSSVARSIIATSEEANKLINSLDSILLDVINGNNN